MADVLDNLWGGEETLIVISTDLSHFLDYEACQALDTKTVSAIENFDLTRIANNQACGRIPVKGMLETAKARGMEITTLDVRNSGDTAGSKDRVVGYGSWMLTGGKQLSAHEAFAHKMQSILKRYGTTLLQVSAASIKRGAIHKTKINLDLDSFPDALKTYGASFVTIEKNGGQLRGCIGTLQGYQPLVQDIAENAYKAAFSDPRFPQVSQDELKDLSLHISVLSLHLKLILKHKTTCLPSYAPTLMG